MRFTLSLSVTALSVFAFAVPALATTGCNAEGWEDGWFSDVGGCHSYYPAILYMKDFGIVEGYADGTFRPESPINRAEFTKILMHAVADPITIQACIEDPLDSSLYFSDVPIGAWYEPSVCHAKGSGMIDGYPDGSFKPANLINYAEAAKIAANAYGLEVDENVGSDWGGQDVWFLPYSSALLKRHAVPPTVSRFAQHLTRGEMAELIYRLETGKTSTQWFASLPDGSTVDSLTVTNNLPDVEFSYDGALFTATEGSMGMRDIYASGEWRVMPGFHLTYVRNDEDAMQCDGMSGLIGRCRPVYSMLDLSIGIVERPLAYVRIGLDSSFDENAKETIVDGRAGVSIYDGIECEGEEHALVPLDAKRTLVIRRAIDCNQHPEGYLTSEEQDVLFRSFLDTIDITVPAVAQSAPVMEVTVLTCGGDVPGYLASKIMVPTSSAVADATLQALFSANPISSYPCDGMVWMGNHYRGVTIVGGVATVKLDATFEEIFHDFDEEDKEWYKVSVQRSISANLKQFPSVTDVRYVVQP